jgi:2-dehydropantoate 2-reductase
MRVVVLGAGAVGGVVGGRLHQAGHDVTLVARGAHFEALSARGLTLESPDATDVLDVAVVERAEDVAITDGTVVLLGVKSQDTAAALDAVSAAIAAAGDPACGPVVVCLQNGVDNERQAARRFADVYAVCVMLPATHLHPGVVQAHSSPVTGLLDVGRFPAGVDDTATVLADALNGATFDSRAVPDVMRWKYRKLLMNLLNAVEALAAPTPEEGAAIAGLVVGEAEAVLAAAGIDVATSAEDRARRGDLMSVRATASGARRGGSSWQSVARQSGRIEVDYLNGEICLLGRLHGVPTPVNARLQALATAAARRGDGPRAMSGSDLLALLRA